MARACPPLAYSIIRRLDFDKSKFVRRQFVNSFIDFAAEWLGQTRQLTKRWSGLSVHVTIISTTWAGGRVQASTSSIEITASATYDPTSYRSSHPCQISIASQSQQSTQHHQKICQIVINHVIAADVITLLMATSEQGHKHDRRKQVF